MTATLLTRMAERLDVAPRAPLYTFLDRHGNEEDPADCEEVVRRAVGAAELLPLRKLRFPGVEGLAPIQRLTVHIGQQRLEVAGV